MIGQIDSPGTGPCRRTPVPESPAWFTLSGWQCLPADHVLSGPSQTSFFPGLGTPRGRALWLLWSFKESPGYDTDGNLRDWLAVYYHAWPSSHLTIVAILRM